jgi:hypothetical protein
MIAPKLVSLDSATWARLAKDWKRDVNAKGVLEMLNSGALVPLFTWHHIEELCQHANDTVYQARVSLIQSLRFVTFPKLPGEKANVGSLIDLREAEIAALFQNKNLSFENLAKIVRAEISNGFCSGRDFCAANDEWWDIYRNQFSRERQSLKGTIASIAQFPAGNQKEGLTRSKNLRLRTQADSRAQFDAMARRLAEQIKRHGDQRLDNPDQVAAEFMRAAYSDGLAIYSTLGEPFERLLKHFGVERTRLPKNATNEDVGYEAIFEKILELHETALDLPRGSLRIAFRQEAIPSWIVWREVDRGMKSFPKTTASNITDKMIIPFGLYVDALESDKRVRDLVGRAAKKHSLLKIVNDRLLSRSNYTALLKQLEKVIEG